MNWEVILNSKLAQILGVSLVFIAAWYLTWDKMNDQVDGRFTSLDGRIDHMEEEVVFYREIIKGNEEQQTTLFSAIEGHLKELVKFRNRND